MCLVLACVSGELEGAAPHFLKLLPICKAFEGPLLTAARGSAWYPCLWEGGAKHHEGGGPGVTSVAVWTQ